MAFKRLILLLLIYVHINITKSQGHTKIWTMRDDKFLNFGKDDPDCINQTFIYQKVGGIYFTIPEEINTIILPSSGSIIFQENQEIKFKPRESKCHSDSYNTNHFKLHIIQPMSWFDTDNWKIKDAPNQNKAIPDIDRIPCECDIVEFPTNHSLWIDFNYVPQLTVKQMIINDKTDNLNAFLDTSLGQSMFMFEATSFTEGLCEGPKSCGCHDLTRFVEYFNSVCLNSPVCHEPECLDPIQPIGHCCPICGAMIQFTANEDYCTSNLRSVNEYMELSILRYEEFAGKVDGYIGMVRGEHDKEVKVQIIAVDKGEYEELSVALIKRMSENKRFINSLKGDGSLWLKSILNYRFDQSIYLFTGIIHQVLTSGRPHRVTGSFSTWFIVFSSLLLVLSMYGTIYLYYSEDSKLRKYNPFNRLQLFTSPFVFARFDNTRDDDTQSIAVGVEFEEANPSTSIYETIASAFDNPMFKGRSKENKIENIGPNVLNECAGDDGKSVASVKLVEVELDSNEES